MTLHVEEIFLKDIDEILNNSKDIFQLAECNCYVKKELEGYAEQGNVQRAGEYFILNYRINKKMHKLLSNNQAFKSQ